jgi:metal-dependent amidase/aminoacylase/carboxypeptidase family protein
VALGAQVEITTLPGYMPLVNDPVMSKLFKENFLSFYGENEWEDTGHRTGSTDMGDISYMMPALHPHVGGFVGTGHGSDWKLTDRYMAYVLPAKLMAMTVIDLLAEQAAGAKELLDGYKPLMSRDQYLTFMRQNSREESFDGASVGRG